MNQINIAVVFGGVSSEHEVSLVSAETVLENLDKTKYQIYPIGITKDGAFFYYTGAFSNLPGGAWENGPAAPCLISPSRIHHGMLVQEADGSYQTIRLDAVIPVLHGKNGEDGTIQGLLELAGIPYVGCDVLSGAACMDKQVTHVLLQQAGVPMAKWIAAAKEDRPDDIEKQVAKTLEYPVFVKPANAGSSVGVSKVRHPAALQSALELAFRHDRKVLVEQMVNGREVECAVLGNRGAVSSVPGEIKPGGDFYDYAAKYQSEDSALYIPARVDKETQLRLQRTAELAFRAMGCTGLARVDFFVTDDNDIILNELNTFPGFTGISMYPKLWEHMGVPIPALLDRLIDCALSR